MKICSATPLLLLLNGGTKPVNFCLPEGSWEILMDTASEDQAAKASPLFYRHRLEGFSLALLKGNDSFNDLG
jgi:hypothetical protein